MSKTIYSLFEQTTASCGDKPLFIIPGQEPVSFNDALTRVHQLATVLQQLGVQPGDRVAVQVGKSVDAVLLYLACVQTGGVFLPLNTAYTSTEVDYFLNDASPRVFVHESLQESGAANQHAHRASSTLAVESLGTAGDGSLMQLAVNAVGTTESVACTEDDPAAILYTSGTTGRSKGAVLTHKNLTSNCESLLDAWRFTANDTLIHALPIFHTHGLFVACNMALSAGASMIFLDKFDAGTVIDHMADATVLMGVPTFYTRLLADPRLSHDSTAGMRLFVAGSAPLSAEHHREFFNRTGHAILERYGMTETCMIASNPYDGERRPGAVGMPLPGIQIRIVDRHSGSELPSGEIGSIEVKGPNVFQGYWQMPEKTASEFREDGFFITGDLGLIDDDGYLCIVGRDKDLVISGGYNVYPKEVEVLIDELPEVTESAVIGLPHPDLGEAVTAIIVPRPHSSIDREQVLEQLHSKLARYKLPKKIILLEELPRNVMGKVQKAALRTQYHSLYQE